MRLPILALIALLAGLTGAAAQPAPARQPAPAQPTSPAVTCREGSPQDAVAACTGILSRKDLAPEARALILTNRGNAYGKMRDLDNTLVDFDAAIKLNPKLAAAHNFRGLAYRSRGEYELAIESYTNAINLQPNIASYYSNRGIAYRWKREADLALADLNTSIKLDPNRAVAFAERAVVLRIKQDYARALADHNEAVRLAPNAWQSYSYRAFTHEARNDFRSALADFRKAQSLNPREELARAITRMEGKIAAASQQPAGPQAQTPQGSVSVQGGGQRVALVIGNSRYASTGALPNPRNDAEALGSALRAVGFNQVAVRHDLSREQLAAALKDFAAVADKAEWAVIYYAGHGIEVGGNNYLVPVDAKLTSDRDVSFEAVTLDQVLQSVEGASKLRLVILDACRDNPFVQKMIRSGTRSIGKGLGNIEPEGTTLVAYSAKHGQTAEDGAGSNSPFTAALVRNIRIPGQEINLVFRKVHDEVMAATEKRQQPFTYGALPSEPFYFRPK